MADKKVDLSLKYYSPVREERKRLLAQRTEKWCNRCKQVLPIDAFYQPSASGLSGISGWCILCTREYQAERRRKVRERKRLRRLERELKQRESE